LPPLTESVVTPTATSPGFLWVPELSTRKKVGVTSSALLVLKLAEVQLMVITTSPPPVKSDPADVKFLYR
jgi:hypothetical protein